MKNWVIVNKAKCSFINSFGIITLNGAKTIEMISPIHEGDCGTIEVTNFV